MLGVEDPDDNYAFDLHQYLDADSSGTATACVSETIGVERTEAVTTWLEDHGVYGFLGEFGGSDDPTCLLAMNSLLEHVGSNAHVWHGWTAWAASPWGSQHNLSPLPDGSDVVQTQVLLRHLDPR